MTQASYSLAKVNGNNYGNISLAMCHATYSLNHQNCLAESNCIMPILLLNKRYVNYGAVMSLSNKDCMNNLRG